MRVIPVYGRAHMANTLILARLWHVIRTTTLPAAFFNKASSIIYKFLTHAIFPQIRKSIIYQPRSEGDLSVINILSHQQVLKNRYIVPLLHNNTKGHKLPVFLMQLLVSYLQQAFDTLHFEIPLLFLTVRKPTHLAGLHILSPLLRSIDNYPLLEPRFELKLNLTTCLEIPFTYVCLPNEELPRILSNVTICSKEVSHFFTVGPLDGKLRFKTRLECNTPSLVARIKTQYLAGNLHFVSYFTEYLSNTANP